MIWKLEMLLPRPSHTYQMPFLHYSSSGGRSSLEGPPIRRFYTLPAVSMMGNNDYHIPKQTNTKPSPFVIA